MHVELDRGIFVIARLKSPERGASNTSNLTGVDYHLDSFSVWCTAVALYFRLQVSVSSMKLRSKSVVEPKCSGHTHITVQVHMVYMHGMLISYSKWWTLAPRLNLLRWKKSTNLHSWYTCQCNLGFAILHGKLLLLHVYPMPLQHSGIQPSQSPRCWTRNLRLHICLFAQPLVATPSRLERPRFKV